MSKCSPISVWNCNYAAGTATNARDMRRSSNYKAEGEKKEGRKWEENTPVH